MKGCSPECEANPACDFCRHFHAGPFIHEPTGITIRIEDGWCQKHKRPTYLGSFCDDFWCMNVPVTEIQETAKENGTRVATNERRLNDAS